ncbi:arginase [Sporolactobacillus sp. THM7-7]|nr:arginase [Sporolactobacillus sp. THM7-7]
MGIVTLLHHDITFLNFDGSYDHQKRLTSIPHRWIDFLHLRGTSLYCSPEAFHVITRRLRDLPNEGLIFLGSGNYHYAALALLRKIHVPFTLILFDHHTDFNKGQIGTLLSCGSWVRHAVIGIPNLEKVIMIGPNPNRSIPETVKQKVTVIPERRLPAVSPITSLVPTRAIHISIDKDVLAPRYAKTNWDQGNLSIQTLGHMIEVLSQTKETEGIDVCGEWPIRPHEQLNRHIRQWVRKNEYSNRLILKMFHKALHKTAAPSIDEPTGPHLAG